MRKYVRTAVVGALLCAGALTAVPAGAAGNTAYPEPSKQEHLYTVPVAGITDVGDLTKLALLGHDFAGLLGH